MRLILLPASGAPKGWPRRARSSARASSSRCCRSCSFLQVSGAAKVGFERDSNYRNCLTISKAAVDDPSCLTKAQEQILQFLIEVIDKPTVSGARMWYPEVKANGEETGCVVFRSSVLHQIRGGALQGGTGQMQTSKTLKKMSQDVRRQALDMFERANLMIFRAETGGAEDKSTSVANPIAAMPGVTRRATHAAFSTQ